ncbi:MAG: ParB N-terminal domain-containing protein, partial [Phycisphaerales bacterium]
MSDTINTKPKKLGRGLASLIGMPITLPDSVLRGEAAAVGGEGGSVAAGIPAGDGHDAGGGPSQGENEGKNEGDTGATLGGRRLVFAKVDEVVPSPFQPRRNFDEGSLSALAESIRSAGVMQPVLVRRVGVTSALVAGERRWRAARTAGLFEIPAVVVNIT